MDTITTSIISPAPITVGSLPTTIGGVITRLEGIIAECAEKNDRAGYFAVLYHRVTCKVRDCIAAKDFEDCERMERLDVIFANRYIEAYDLWRTGKMPTASWKIAFETTKVNVPLVMQHLLLGMNAHINLDLGIAAAEVMKGYELEDIKNDFFTINKVLADLVGACEACMIQVNPLLRLLHLNWYNYDEMLVAFSINTARDGAWAFATEIGPKENEAYKTCLATRDVRIAELGAIIAQPKGLLLRAVIQACRMFERKKISDVIKLLGA